MPFGWAPKTCVGAGIATIHLMALCYLMSTRYRLTVSNMETVTVHYRFAPVPQRFHGYLERREGGPPTAT